MKCATRCRTVTSAYEMRNALSHGYFTVDLAIVWQTVQQDLPALRTKVAALVSP